MIRPRLGDFSYSQAEIQSMELDIDAVREANLNGIVFGANRSNIWELDDKIMERLARRAQVFYYVKL
jgi:copper homeostasis protein